MTLAAIKKLAIKLPLAQRLKLADAMWKSVPVREPLTLAQLEARADEIELGKVKAVSSEEFDLELVQLEKEIFHKRPRQRG